MTSEEKRQAVVEELALLMAPVSRQQWAESSQKYKQRWIDVSETILAKLSPLGVVIKSDDQTAPLIPYSTLPLIETFDCTVHQMRAAGFVRVISLVRPPAEGKGGD